MSVRDIPAGGFSTVAVERARVWQGEGMLTEPEVSTMATPIPTSETQPRRSLTMRAWDFAPTAVAILRIGAGLLFMQHGLQKLFGLLGGFGGTPGATAPLMSLMGLAGVLEFVGGLLLVVGLFVRPVALILAMEMIVAYVQAHLPNGGFPVQNGGELALLYAFVFFFLAARGAGPISVDARQGRADPHEIPHEKSRAAPSLREKAAHSPVQK
jgi:putative oxidoreductase